jgi:SAM-dependent methyltransferase
MIVAHFYRRLRFALREARMPKTSSSTEVGPAKLIWDTHRRLGDFTNANVELDVSINKESLARKIIFDVTTPPGRFLEVGGGEGDLRYLLGVRGNLEFDDSLYDENLRKFNDKFHYVGNDLLPRPEKEILAGDLCAPDFLSNSGYADGFAAVAYSNNVFEHLKQPWIAATNIYRCLQPGGVGITVVPFSQRYHEAPVDYFRYTHTGIASLFESAGPIETLASGYDVLGRRNDWQGGGKAKDIVPVDEFGAWRETWFTFHAFRKPVR